MNPLDEVMSFMEAAKKWGIDINRMQQNAYGRVKGVKAFRENEIKKSEGTWLITCKAMYRVYGEPREKKVDEK